MRKAVVLVIFLFCLTNICFAQLNEFAQVAQSKYFIIYSQDEADLLKLAQRLNIRSEYLLLEGASLRQEQLQDSLGIIVDAIFLEASDVLHMYLYKFKGNIRICQNQEELKRFFGEFSHGKLNAPAFYAQSTDSIYVNPQKINPQILAYEIAHIIIAHYFAVLPPKEVREILAKDVGSRIRKLAK
ncbi:MAG: hypothetical protein ABIC18_00350 [Candidatus Omnitrophota bacterium]